MTFCLDVFGYSGNIIDDKIFDTEKEALEYFQTEYGGDGGIFYELSEKEIIS